MLSLPDLNNYHEPLALDVTSIQFVAIGFFFYVPITFISFKVLESSAFCLKYLALVFVNLCTSLAWSYYSTVCTYCQVFLHKYVHILFSYVFAGLFFTYPPFCFIICTYLSRRYFSCSLKK